MLSLRTSSYKKVLALYDFRLDADYRALPIEATQAQDGLDTVQEVFRLIMQQKEL